MKTTMRIMIVIAAATLVGCVTQSPTGVTQKVKTKLYGSPMLITNYTGDKSRLGIALGDRVRMVYGDLLLFGQEWEYDQMVQASSKMTPLNWAAFDAEDGYRFDAVGCIKIGRQLFGFEMPVPVDPQGGTIKMTIYGGSAQNGVKLTTPMVLMQKIASGEYPLIGTFTGTLGHKNVAKRLLSSRPLKLSLMAQLTTNEDWLNLLNVQPEVFFDDLDTMLKMIPDGDRDKVLTMALPALADASSVKMARRYLGKAIKDNSARVTIAAVLPYCERLKPDLKLLLSLDTLSKANDSATRKRVISILSKHDVGTTIIVRRLADADKEVRNMAFVRLDRLDRPFNDSEIKELGDLLTKAPRSFARDMALKLLSKASVENSNRFVILAMGDNDSDIRKSAVKLMNSRQITESDLRYVESLARHKLRRVRLSAIALLKRSKVKRATFTLLELLEDTHYDVRDAAFAAVKLRATTAEYVRELSKLLNAAPSDTRCYAAELLGAIDAADVTDVLTKRLDNERHYKVRDALMNALHKRLAYQVPSDSTK